MKKLLLLLSALPFAAFPQGFGSFPPSGGGPCQVTGSPTTGYVLTATTGTQCQWQTVGSASVGNNTIANAWAISDTGTANAIIGTTVTAFPGAYAPNQAVLVRANATNTGATTININGLGNIPVTKNGATALAAGNKVAGDFYLLAYDGTEFQMLNFTLLAADLPALACGNLSNGAPSCSIDTTNAANISSGILARARGGTNNTAGAIPQLFFGTAAPGSVAGNLPGDFYSDTLDFYVYQCQAPSGTAAPACTAVGLGNWVVSATHISGGGVGSIFTQGLGPASPPVSLGPCATGAPIVGGSSGAGGAMICGSVLGTAAYLNTGTSAGNVVALNGSAQLPAVSGVNLTAFPATVALTTNPLSQFAATTSAQLAGIISDETGSGAAVFGTSPTIVTPTIASFVNANHNHSNAAGGGQLGINGIASSAIQGTDTKLLSSGTISGLAATLCTDSNGGATTTGCTSGSGMVYPSGSGIPIVVGGTAWGVTVAAPVGTVVGTTDTQTLTNKSIAGSEINSGLVGSTVGGTGVNNSATLTLGSANINYATLGTGIEKNTTTTGAQTLAAATDISAILYAVGGGTANAQAATYSPAISSLVVGTNVCWLPAAANTTTTPSFSPNSLTVKTITKSGGAALAASDLTTTAVACAIYDGTNWELQNPQTASSGGITGIGVQVAGTTAGTRPIINFPNTGSGITQSCVDNPGQNRVDCNPTINTSIVATHDSVHANEVWENSTTGNTSYLTTTPYKTIAALAAGMVFTLAVDTTCSSACTLRIDGQPSIAAAIKQIDGATDPGGQLIAGQPQWIYYDGTVFRLMGAAGGSMVYPSGSGFAIVSGGTSWGTTLADPLTGTHGGTGVNNGSNTITLSGNLTTTGAFNPTFAIPSSSTWTFPSGGGSLANLNSTMTGTWNGSVIGSAYGGTGVNNTVTLTLGTTAINYATLGTGIEKNTTTTGAQSIASASDIAATLYGTGGGTANSQTVTLTPAVTAQAAGLSVCWLPAAANTTTTPTVAISGLTAKTITKLGTTALAASDLTTTALACAIYDGTEYQLQNPQTLSGGSTIPAVTNLISGSGTANVGADSGIAPANVVTSTANFGGTGYLILASNSSSRSVGYATNWMVNANTLQNVVSTGAATFQCGADSATSKQLCTFRPADLSGSTANAVGGSLLLRSANNSSTATTSMAGIAELSAGVSTGATPGLQGLLMLDDAYNQSGTNSLWKAQCPTTGAKTVVDCPVNATNVTGIAVNLFSGTVGVSVALTGSVVPATLTSAGTKGHTICPSATVVGEFDDSGGTGVCPGGFTAGVIEAVAWAWPTGVTTFPNGVSLPTISTTLVLARLTLQSSGGAFALGSTGTATAGHLACATSSNTMGNCTGTPSNNFVGVFNSSGTYQSAGIVTVTLDATVNVTYGDNLCASSTSAGTAHDNGSSACSPGEAVGIVTTTASSVSSATASLRFY